MRNGLGAVDGMVACIDAVLGLRKVPRLSTVQLQQLLIALMTAITVALSRKTEDTTSSIVAKWSGSAARTASKELEVYCCIATAAASSVSLSRR